MDNRHLVEATILGIAGEDLLINQSIVQGQDDRWYVDPTGFRYAAATASVLEGEPLGVLINYDKRDLWNKLRIYFTTNTEE